MRSKFWQVFVVVSSILVGLLVFLMLSWSVSAKPNISQNDARVLCGKAVAVCEGGGMAHVECAHALESCELATRLSR